MTDYDKGLLMGVVLGVRLACILLGRNFQREFGGAR